MKPASLAALLLLGLSTAAAAQTPPSLTSGQVDKGWSGDGHGLAHASGLSCPSAVWAGLGDKAPISFDTSPFAGVAVDATCQYYTYWDSGKANETRLVVNLSKMPDPAAYVAKWSSMKSDAVTGTFEYAGKTYRTLKWNDGARHTSTVVTRAEAGSFITIMFVRPDTYSEDKVWPIVDALFAANP